MLGQQLFTPAIRCLVIVLLLMLFVGCKAAPVVIPHVEHEFVRDTFNLRNSLDAGSIYAPVTGNWDYEITSGEGSGGRIAIRRTHADRFDADWSDDLGGERTNFWRRDADGSVVLTATLDHGDQAISIFDPPLLLAPASLAPGESHTSEATMRVVDSRDETIQRERGTAVQQIEHLGGARVATPMGEFDVAVVRIEFTARLTFAEASSVTTLFVSPDAGLVAEDSGEQIAVLGMRGRKMKRTMLITASTAPSAGE